MRMPLQPLARMAACLSLGSALLGCAATTASNSPEALRQQVMDAERAFARTMADRDHAAFATFLSDEAVFFSGPQPLRGKQSVVESWARFYRTPEAPFSWEPDQVEVLESGTLAISSGPVHDASGKLVARFTSIWRFESPGRWRVVFDKGNPECDCKP
jgi:ketosteroid isomerase-like protein